MGRYLGQHFLIDEGVLQGIIDAIFGIVKKHNIQTMREIGPGQGALTKHIYKLVDEFICFEKDETMKKYLGQFLQEEQVFWGDILDLKIESLQQRIENKNILVVGNLPYYITSPIFRKFFGQMKSDEVSDEVRGKNKAGDRVQGIATSALLSGDSRNTSSQGRVVGGVFLIQKEVADKIKSDARKKSYLRWLLNNQYTIEYLFTVPPTSFDPPPKVESAVVMFQCRDITVLSCDEYRCMLEFLDLVSSYKRKTLGKIQKMLAKRGTEIIIPDNLLGARLEELGWDEMSVILKSDGKVGVGGVGGILSESEGI